MAFIGNNQNLLLLADVALGTYVPERQQPAHAAAAQEAVTANITPPAERQVTEEEFEKALIDADAFHNAPPARIWRVAPRETRKTRKTTSVPRDQQQPFHTPSHPESATTNSIPSAEQPANSASSEWGRIDDYSSQDEQRPTRASTQLASTITNTNVFPPAPEQPAQAPRTQGFIAINRATVAGGPAPIIPRPLPHHAPVSTGPSGGRQRVTKKSRKSKPRTTGFNRETGEGMMTSVCGTVTPAKGTPATRANKKGNFCCPRCNSNFTRARSVKDHFISCVRKHGNPNGLSWWDHQTLEGSKNWHSDRRPTLNEDDEMESEEDGDEQESGNEQEQDEEESHGDDHGRYAQAIESDVATGEEDVDGDSRLGEEDQGRYNSVNA